MDDTELMKWNNSFFFQMSASPTTGKTYYVVCFDVDNTVNVVYYKWLRTNSKKVCSEVCFVYNVDLK